MQKNAYNPSIALTLKSYSCNINVSESEFAQLITQQKDLPVRNKLLVLIIAVLAALVLTFAFYKTRQPKPVRVLVASQELTKGAFLTGQQVAWARMKSGSVKRGYIVHKPGMDQKIIGSELKVDVAKFKPILMSNLIMHPGGIYAKTLPPGMVAAVVGLPKGAGLSRLIDRGDTVNVILTRGLNNSGANSNKVSETILTKIRVLAVAPGYPQADAKKDSSVTGKKSKGPSTMVLALTPKQNKKLLLASSMGRVTFAVTSVRTGASYYISADGRLLTSAEVSSLPQVTIIRGSQSKTVTLDRE